ncbi:MAG: 3-oxoacyl-[acyl-carrier-protein] reductase [Sandaracinaceae bacterium]|nr:MAG: 3-oxoacyl-[acyl-carrier-protein] reductase [Sandaracinaceae bacterium]HBQ16563.1 3-oxoacyl-[acyl-carrier-protein] reductase [Myxococcales bacterium]
MFDLTGKVALVTGGSRGIGRAVCVALAKAGARVIVNYAGNEAAAAETLKLVREAGSDGELLRFDVSDPEAVDAAIAAAAKRHEGLHILVNNAGIAIDQLLIRIKPEELEKTMAVNVGGALWCSKAAIRLMMRKRYGRVINLTSIVGEAGNAGQAVYSASKAGIIGLTKTLAREYASRGVTVNAVAPGFIETDMTSSLPDKVKEDAIAQTPLGRMGSPEDIAHAVLYLASEEAGFITGHVLRVNGGMQI